MTKLRNLKVGQKYTLVRFGELGFLFSLQITLDEIRVEPFAQHPESVVLLFRRRQARSRSGMRFLPNHDYLVYDGWIDVSTDMYVTQNADGSRTSLLSFDREYFAIARRSVARQPLLEKVTPCPAADTAAILGRR